MSHKAVSLPVVLVSALLFTGLAADAQNAGADSEFYASSRRPLSDVLKAISAKYGWVISYEDPRYSHVDDIEDVTPPGRSRPALVPRGGAFRYSAPTLIAEASSDQGLPIPHRSSWTVAFTLPTCSLNDPLIDGGMER